MENVQTDNVYRTKDHAISSSKIKIWLISDTHFWHANIIKFCGRPYNDVSHMHTCMRETWNSCVSSSDLVLHLGDCAFISGWNYQYALDYLSSLNGKKTIVLGNHDRKKAHQAYLELGWKVETKWIQVDDVLYSHHPFKTMGQAPSRVEFNVHGHEHHFVPREDHWNVCCDLRDWKPVLADEIPFVNVDALRSELIRRSVDSLSGSA